MNLDQSQLLVVYLLLFLAVGVGFIFVHLVAGWLVRPSKPESEKLTIYECGEPTIGSAWIQFDVRFYVVALLFVIFDVEVAFFFPWAVVFGHATKLSDRDLPPGERSRLVRELVPVTDQKSQGALDKFDKTVMREHGLQGDPADYSAADKAAYETVKDNVDAARHLAWIAFWDVAVFFAVLIVGFAYLWKRGDLEWVRSVAAEEAAESGHEPPGTEEETLVGAGADQGNY